MKLSKWKWEVIVISLVVAIGLACWWADSTKAQRAEDKEIDVMIKYAQRQALEIAIIEQASKLAGYKKQLAAAQQAKQPSVLMPMVPTIPDPVDVK